MKFNSVEISGFRIYDDPKNATFSFVTNDGNTADFVSLYAPNGFGKTSFYDAVEWGITNNVDRFWVNKNTEKSIDALRHLTSKQIQLLRNNITVNKTYVKILDSSNEVFVDRLLKINKQRKTDIDKITADNRENLDFLKVILSQEWISGFLKEVDGKARYKKFMENNGMLQEVDIYYQSVIALAKANTKNITSIEKQIEQLKAQIIVAKDKNLLKTINSQINKLNKISTKDIITKIELTTTQSEIKNLRDKLTLLLSDEREIKSIESELKSIIQAKIGNEKMYSQKQYFEARKELIKLNSKLKDITFKLADFKELNGIKNELNQKNEQKKELVDELKKLDIIKKLLPDYLSISKQISIKEESISTNKKLLQQFGKKLEISQRKLIEISNRNNEDERKRLEIIEEIEILPKLKIKIDNLDNDIPKLKKSLETQKKQVLIYVKKNNTIENRIDELLKVIEDLKLGQYSEISLGKNKIQINNLKKLEVLDKLKLKLNKEFSEIQEHIHSQESFDKTIKEFIASGLSIVNRSKTDTCPLCEQSYEDYKILADKISNNKALSDLLKTLLKERSQKNKDIEDCKDQRLELINELEKFYSKEINKLLNNKKINIEIKEEVNKNLDLINLQILEKHKELLDLNSRFNGTTFEKYTENQKAQLEKVVKNNKTIIDSLKTTKSDNEKLLSEQNKLFGIVKLLEGEIIKLKENSNYYIVLDWKGKNIDDTLKFEDYFINKLNTKQEESKVLELKLSSLHKSEKKISDDLKKFKEPELDKELKTTFEAENLTLSKVETYEFYIKNNFSIEVVEIDDIEFNKQFLEKEKVLKNRLVILSELNVERKKLEGLTENIMPFLQSENAKSDLESMDKEMIFLNTKVGGLLKKEILKTKIFLDKQIKDFFYEGLINEIYSKIDPHPNFKTVSFKVTFSETSSPSLDVFVKNSDAESEGDSLIPNLYFSTAQINILSLSIFLASALNSKEFDCIFIDDPIQSMDSINILSTIDLFRSIIVNSGKQIILSTHDENFHNLLKMKIPSSLFKSKFLELESFGKLKSS